MNTTSDSPIEIRPLIDIDIKTLHEIIIGYPTQEVFSISKSEKENEITFTLKLKPLSSEERSQWKPGDAEMMEYRKACAQGTCVGAYMGQKVVGVAIAGIREWNKTLWVLEFHVHPDFHRSGIGSLMMAEMVDIAREKGLRVMVCETQNTNVSAIRFYQAMGFTMDGIDLSYYSNEDYRNDAIAVFMKRKIE